MILDLEKEENETKVSFFFFLFGGSIWKVDCGVNRERYKGEDVSVFGRSSLPASVLNLCVIITGIYAYKRV